MKKSRVLYQFINDMKYWLDKYGFDYDYSCFGLCYGFTIRKNNINEVDITIFPESCLAVLDDRGNSIYNFCLFNTDHRKIKERDAYTATRAICTYLDARINDHEITASIALDISGLYFFFIYGLLSGIFFFIFWL